jgi:hypothetical protein
MSDMLQMDRRTLLERVLLLAGGTAAAGFSGSALAKAAAGPRIYLDPAVFNLLSAVADTIVPRTDTPGAIDARVPAKFDALLANWASGERRYELSQALLKIDALARDKAGKAFAELTPEQRKEVLTGHDIEALKPVPDTRKLSGMLAMMAGPSLADPGYAKLKELIVLLYYYSEEALTTELAYEHAPGGWTPSIKVTAETRPMGGMGMF